jgi:hypothetical protein
MWICASLGFITEGANRPESGGDLALAFPIIWGSVFIVIRRLDSEPSCTVLTVGTAIGVVVLIFACLVDPKNKQII